MHNIIDVDKKKKNQTRRRFLTKSRLCVAFFSSCNEGLFPCEDWCFVYMAAYVDPTPITGDEATYEGCDISEHTDTELDRLGCHALSP